MTTAVRRIPFKVDVAGVIQIMGSALYSRPDTPVRELIQNAHDAIMRRRRRDLSFQGRIDIRTDPEARTLSISDDGIGLNMDEAERYLGTVGLGVTGLLKGHHPSTAGQATGEGDGLIGQFGIGLFSAFLLADRIVVDSRRMDCPEAVCWAAGGGTDIELSAGTRDISGTTVTLHLKDEFQFWAARPEAVEAAVREFADFLPLPIYLNGSQKRLNVINVAWFDASPDPEAVELALQEAFGEAPLNVIPVRLESPAVVSGALYVTPQRTPGFSGEALVTSTIQRMVISRRTRDLLPGWASFVRGVLELNECVPTASREDLVREKNFHLVRQALEEHLFEHFTAVARDEPAKWQSILSYHRYSFAGAALAEPQLRELLFDSYQFPTSQGLLTFKDIFARSQADPLFETEFEHIVWYNTDRRQEAWANALFASQAAPCVHTLRSFEESLLAAFVGDASNQAGPSDLRVASPGAPQFAQSILGVSDLEDAPAEWQQFLEAVDARIFVASISSPQPVLAFLNDHHDLLRTFEELRKQGAVPSSFQRLIDSHFEDKPAAGNEVILNRNHRMVARALSQKTSMPIASAVRLLVWNAMHLAGAALPSAAISQQADDLDWIADALWGRS